MDNIFSINKNNLRTHLVEVEVDSQGGTYYLDDDYILREKQILGFMVQPSDLVYGIAALGTAPVSPKTGRPLALTPAIFSGFLTVKCGTTDMVETYPLIAGVITQNNPQNFVPFQYNSINPSKSYIQIADATNNAVTGSSFLLYFYFLED